MSYKGGQGLIKILEILGERARWVLAVGVIAALLFPELSAPFAGTLPFMVVLVFALAVARLNIGEIAQRAVKPRRMFWLMLWVSALMIATPVVFWSIGQALALPPPLVASLVFAAAAPPITSSAALCLIIGLDAALALELTVIASLLTPLIGPAIASALLGESLPIGAVEMGVRTGTMIVLGTIAGLLLRMALGPKRIEERKIAFDGAAAIAVVLFILPLFDGIGAALAREPMYGAGVLVASVLANIGMQLFVWSALRPFGAALGLRSSAQTGAMSLVWGNRTIALYLAALPGDPVFQLFVALYQIPMLMTPLLMRRVFNSHRATTGP